MNSFQKQVRRDVKRGITIEGVPGGAFIQNSKATFSNEKGIDTAVLLKVKGPAFDGRVRVLKPDAADAAADGAITYQVVFLKRSGWFYHPIKTFKGVYSQQLTAVLDAVVSGTAEVESL